MSTRYTEGDVVATPDSRGVVAAVLTDDFEFPQGDDELTGVSASNDQPAYVVALEQSGSAAFRASALETASLEGDTAPDISGEALTEVVDEDVDGIDNYPPGWDYESILEYWNSIGGTWEDCAEDLADELGDDRARQLCSAMKDEALGTTRWRNRF
jgi:hypothetical protein